MEKDSNEKPKPGRRITLRDIARQMGVSHATVSLALRDSPQISAATKANVRRVAQEMNYRPDPMLAALAHYRLSNQDKPTQAALAWINPLSEPARLRQLNEFNLYWEGAEEAAHQMGFYLEEFSLKDISLHRMNSIFKARNIRGVLIAPLRVPGLPDLDIDWNVFPWADYATIRFGRSTGGPATHFVTSAQTANTMLSFEKIREKGYQRIGFVGGTRLRRFFKAGYYMAQSEAPKNQRLSPIAISETAPHSEQLKILETWLIETRPDAIIVERPGISEMLKELNIHVPDDIGLTTSSIHDTSIDTGIHQNPREIGIAAIRMLASMLNHNDFGIPTIQNEILIGGRWVNGSMLPDRN